MLRLCQLSLLLLFGFSLQGQQTIGLFLNDSLAQNGYTLLAPGSATKIYLIDNCGQVVNTWQSNYQAGEVAYLLENGNLLRAARYPGDYHGGGVGGRIEMFDWDGNLIWGYNHATSAYHSHHDVEYLPNGNILLIAWEGHSRAEAIAAGRDPNLTPANGVWFEQVVEIEPVGTTGANIVWEWHLIDHLVQDFDNTKANYGEISEHPELLDANFNASANGPAGQDWIHFNSVDYNPELDQIIVNSRSTNEFYILDHSTTSAEAAGHSGGNSGKGGDFLYRWGNPRAYDRGVGVSQKLFGQHDAHWIPPGYPDAGKIMIFNNGQSRPSGSFSTIDVIVPPLNPTDNSYTLNPGAAYGPNALFWTYVAPLQYSFYAANISGAQRQRNGNTLICEGPSGHIFEVDMDGNIHWDYINPVFGNNPAPQGASPTQNNAFRAYRYTPDFPAFVGKDLTPSGPIELNPLPSNCQIYDGTVAISALHEPGIHKAYPNPVSEILTLENPAGQDVRFQLLGPTGKLFRTGTSNDSKIELNLSEIPSGLYFLQVSIEKQQSPSTVKIIKK